MSNPAAGTDASLLFDWSLPKGEKLAIIGFLTASVILHAFCFYLFQIAYPPAVALLAPPARVSLITPDSEEGKSLLRWIDAEDPALASATVRPPEGRSRALPRLGHIPSYVTKEPQLKHAPPLSLEPPALSSQPPAPVTVTRRKAEIGPTAIPTHILLSDELSSLGQPTLAASKFTASSNEPPEAVRFRIAVGPQGDVRYCFRLNSSGDSALDEQARQHVVLCRFPTSRIDSTLIWGVATVEWGNDIVRPTSPSTKPAP